MTAALTAALTGALTVALTASSLAAGSLETEQQTTLSSVWAVNGAASSPGATRHTFYISGGDLMSRAPRAEALSSDKNLSYRMVPI